jgi:hypothetical protein
MHRSKIFPLMSAQGQTEKNSARAYLVRFTPVSDT